MADRLTIRSIETTPVRVPLARTYRGSTDEITPLLIGEDAFAIERCWELARPVTFDILRNRRLGLVATACVDAALWDAAGKALGAPLWRLWAGWRFDVAVVAL